MDMDAELARAPENTVEAPLRPDAQQPNHLTDGELLLLTREALGEWKVFGEDAAPEAHDRWARLMAEVARRCLHAAI
jgi:hypothetical protein